MKIDFFRFFAILALGNLAWQRYVLLSRERGSRAAAFRQELQEFGGSNGRNRRASEVTDVARDEVIAVRGTCLATEVVR